MTETLHIPQHIQMTLRIAVQEQHSATSWTAREAELRDRLDAHQRQATRIREEIEAELQRARADAERRLDALAEDERRLTGELAEAGRCREHHGREAIDAQQSVMDWCTRHGVRPDDLPQPDVTGPMPVISAGPHKMPYTEHVGQRVEILIVGDEKRFTGLLARVDEAGLRVVLPEGEQTIPPEHVAALRPAISQSQPIPLVAPAVPADPAHDPLTTRADPLPAGGDEPAQGPFQDRDTAGPDVAPRTDGDGMTGDTSIEQDGDDRG